MKQETCTRHARGRSSLAGMVIRTCCSVAALVAVMIGMPFSSMADDLPLVYAVENTGAGYPAPPLPTLANLPTILPLPDPFAWANAPFGSTRSTNFVDWSHHRAEIKAQIENYEIGYKPPVDPTNIFASYSGSATSGTLTVRVTNIVSGVARTLTLTCAIAIPAGAGPFPAIIGMNSPNGSISLGGRAIATITYLHDQVTTYNNPQNSNPYYALYAAPYSPALNIDNTGQYSAWAWGVSRIIDGLYYLNGTLGTAQINLQRIGVTGCSYAGKMALFAGALDERVALTIPQESGGGGVPNWRYSYQMEADGTVEGLAQTSSQWFRNSMFDFGGANTAKLPEDHHELMAMVAPRALFATANPQGAYWLSNPSAYVSFRAVQRVYETFGISDRFGYNGMLGAPHCGITEFLNADVGAFLDKFLLGITSVNTITNRHVPSDYSSIDYARWTAWWGTTNPVFPQPPSFSLSIPAAATEGDGTLAGQGRLSTSPAPTSDLTVNLTSSRTSEVTVPASVVIPAGQTNAVFDLTIIDDSLLDGDQVATITASTLNTNAYAAITVHDNETATLSVTLPASASEAAGTLVNAGSVSIGTAAGANVTVSLSSSDTSRLIVPSTTVISTGQTSAVFNLTFVNNKVIEGPQTASVTAHVPNWTDGSASMTILDDDLPDHFAWSAVPSPQLIGEPFPVTITAQDISNNTIVNWRFPVALSALIAGNATGTNTILNSPSPEQSLRDGFEKVLGYSFTPGTNLKVTHVRHYFGDKVSIWADSGRLLVSQNVVSVPGTWVDTPLPAPLLLPAGGACRIVVHENDEEYFWSQDLPSTFPDGTINQSFWDYGDVFPTRGNTADWYFVDLRYATDVVSVPVNPGATANFSSGTWSGNLAVLQAGTNVMLQASAGAGSSGASVPFNVLGRPVLEFALYGDIMLITWPVAPPAMVLEVSDSLSPAIWVTVPYPPLQFSGLYVVPVEMSAPQRFYRLRFVGY